MESGVLEHRQCPECGTTVPVNPGYVTWCDRCNWNRDPTGSSVDEGFLGRLYATQSIRHGRDLHEEVRGQAELPPTKVTSTVVAVYALATLVHATTLLLGLAGVAFLLAVPRNVLAVLPAAFCLLLAWLSRPRSGPAPRNPIDRSRCPALYRLVDEIAAELGAKPVHQLAVSADYGAATQNVGIVRAQTHVTVGLPLFAVLTSQERVAVLSHEVAHQVNGDPMRGVWLTSAVRALMQWAFVLDPGFVYQLAARGLTGLAASILMVPINLIRIGLSRLLQELARLMFRLVFRSAQRSEYVADRMAASIAGTDAAVSALEKSYFGNSVVTAVQMASTGRSDDMFQVVRHYVSAAPERERIRLRRSELARDLPADSTHPPIGLRIDVLQTAPVVAQPTVTLTAAEAAAVDAELAQYEPEMQRQAIDAYRARLTNYG